MLLDSLSISPLHIVLSLLIIFLAYSVKGLSGFGSGLVAIPLLAFIFPLTVIVPVLGLLSYSGTVIQSTSFWRHVKWSDIWTVLPFSLVGIFTAVWVLANVDESKLVFILGVFIFLYAASSLGSFGFTFKNKFLVVIVGGFGGLVGALFGTGGPFYVIYLKARQLDKGQFRATMVMIFLFDGGARISGYAFNGFYDQQTIILVLLLSPMLLLGLKFGHQLHDKIDQHKFNFMINILLSLSGMILMLKSWSNLSL